MLELRSLFYKVLVGLMPHKGGDRGRHQGFGEEHLKRTEGGNLLPFTAAGAWSCMSAVCQ